MEAHEEEVLAKAAASLTVADFHWLKEHDALQEAAPSSENVQTSHTADKRQGSSQEGRAHQKKRKRHQVQHEWP